MSNRKENDEFPPLPQELPQLHRQRCGVVSGVCINSGCSGFFLDERDCQTCDACAVKHCTCKDSEQTLPRTKH